MQQMREQVKAEASISQHLAGVDTAKAADDFLHYANQSEANTEFEQLLGITTAVKEEVSPATAVPAMPVSKLPE